MNEPTVFLVDDDAAVRDSLSLLLSLKRLRTQVFAGAEQFLATYTPDMCGCLLTDLRMPGMSGLELQIELRARGIQLPIVVLTAHGDVATARTALKNGAVDFLEKPVDDAVLVDVLQNAISIDARSRAAASAQQRKLSILERLTPREREVFDLLANGLQNRDIARQLGISPRTVEVYKARVMEKLQCRSAADLVKLSLSVSS